MLIGITGAQGSGKTTLAALLAEKLNAVYVNGDVLSHTLLTEKKFIDLFTEKFGKEILDENGAIVRKKLGAVSLATEDGYHFLNEVCEKALEEKFRKIIDENGITIIDYAPLPMFPDLWKDCDVKVLVDSNKEERKRRVLTRDGIAGDYFEQRDKMAKRLCGFTYDVTVTNNRPQDIQRCVTEIERYINKKTKN